MTKLSINIAASLMALLILGARAVSGCSLCIDGAVITMPDVVIGLTNPIPLNTCGDLVAALIFVGDDQDLCRSARALATICGCPVQENACTICEEGADLTRPQQQLDGLVDLGSAQSEMFGLPLTCALVESSINQSASNETTCLNLPFEDLRSFCGCPAGEDPQADMCSLCPGGEIVVPTTNQTGFPVYVGGEEMLCHEMQELASQTNKNSTVCSDIQAVSTACGCPIPENACKLCGEGTLLEKKSIFMTSDGDESNCRTFEAQLHLIDANSSVCTDGHSEDIESQCLCSEEEVFTPCTLCVNGEASPFPNKEVIGIEGVGFDFIEHKCGVIEQLVLSSHIDSSICKSARVLSHLCGCETLIENPCNLCGEGQTMGNPHQEYDWLFRGQSQLIQGAELGDGLDANGQWTCELAESFLANYYTVEDGYCYSNFLTRGDGCGCPKNTRAAAISWTQRTSGFLSLVGSVMILTFTLLKKPSERWSPYNQIVLSISLFDCFSSVAFIFGTSLTPSTVGIYQSVGNEATCAFQAFLFQAGIASVYYSFALSVYFVLIVKYRWTQRQLRKVQWWTHGLLTGVTVAMACAVIPFAAPSWRLCYVTFPPIGSSWVVGIVFFLIPVAIPLLGITVMTGVLVIFVRNTHKKTQAKRLVSEARKRKTISDRAFWQSMWFLAVFYTVWPIQFAAAITFSTAKTFWVFYLAALLGPLQGFLNALVVFARERNAVKKRVRKLLGIGEAKSGFEPTAFTSSFWASKSEHPQFASSFKLLVVTRKSSKMRDPSTKLPAAERAAAARAAVLAAIGTNDVTADSAEDAAPAMCARDACEVDQQDDYEGLNDVSIGVEDLAFDSQSPEMSDGLLEHALDAGLLDDVDRRHFHASIARIESVRQVENNFSKNSSWSNPFNMSAMWNKSLQK